MKRVLMITALSTLVMLLAWAGTARAAGYVSLVAGTEKWFSSENQTSCLTQKLHTVVSTYPGGLYRMHREVLRDHQVIARDDRLFNYNAEGDIFYFGDLQEPVYAEPILWVDAPLELGKMWADSRPAAAGDDDPANRVHYVFAVLDQSPVCCPAGTFDCYRVFLSEIHPDGRVENLNFWYNPECGMVMCTMEDSLCYSLVKVIPGNGDDETDNDIHNPTADEGVLTGLKGVPNPANPMTVISFELNQAARVTVDVFDLSGRLVKRLLAGEQKTAGPVNVTWQGADESGRAAASGTYLVRVEAGPQVVTRPVTLVR